MTLITNSVIQWKDSNSFNVEIGPDLRKARVNGITGYKDCFMMINFMDSESVRVDYPANLDDFPDLLEVKLKQWDGWKRGKLLTAYFIIRVRKHVLNHLKEIKDAVSIMKSNALTP